MILATLKDYLMLVYWILSDGVPVVSLGKGWPSENSISSKVMFFADVFGYQLISNCIY